MNVTCILGPALNVSAVESQQTRQRHTGGRYSFLKNEKQVSSFCSPLSKFEICLLPPNRTSLMTTIWRTMQCYWSMKLFFYTNETFPKAELSIPINATSLFKLTNKSKTVELRARVEHPAALSHF